MRAILCTGSEDRFAKLAESLLRSVRELQTRDLDIGFLDLDLSPEKRAAIAGLADKVERPGWDAHFTPPDNDPSQIHHGFRAMTARPYLPDYFPGYDIYLWIDADCWVQNWWAVEWLIQGAEAGALTVVPEIDRAYRHFYDNRKLQIWTYNNYVELFGKRFAQQIGWNPVINSGVFAMPANSKIWKRWRLAMQHALDRKTDFYAEQMALNFVVYRTDPPRQFLPAYCNWLVNKALPAFDPVSGQFVEPYLPHHPLGIVHLSGDAKSQTHDLKVVGKPGFMKSRLLYSPGRRTGETIEKAAP